jgi:hypothetical protein
MLTVSPTSFAMNAQTAIRTISITSNTNWTATSDASWISLSAGEGNFGATTVNITAASNHTDASRTGNITFTAGTKTEKITVTQDFIPMPNYVPEGYKLVWYDEFNDSKLSDGRAALPNLEKWWYEEGRGNNGWGNNEIQSYVPGFIGADTCAKIYDGTLKIIAKQVGSNVHSIRMNSRQAWLYGYIEARMKIPTGRGTWPAFWMLPQDNTIGWPLGGEIDIVEAVGYMPNVVHSSVHTRAYNHMVHTEKTASRHVPTAQTAFHVYAIEWTEDYIHGYVDGVRYFTFDNDKTNNRDTWPFNIPFYLKLNLAWGGNWGAAQGIDNSALPATFEIDYVRVYQRE